MSQNTPSQKNKHTILNEPRAIIIAAVITGVFAVVAAWIASLGSNPITNTQTPAPTNTLTVSQTSSSDDILIATISIDGNTFQVFSTQPPDRNACLKYFASGVGNTYNVSITLGETGAFAADGDAFEVYNQMYGSLNHPNDIIVYSDQPGEYRWIGHSFGVCVGQNINKILDDRRVATGNDGRPEYWINPNSTQLSRTN